MSTDRSRVELCRFAGGWPLRFQCGFLCRTSADFCLRMIVSCALFRARRTLTGVVPIVSAGESGNGFGGWSCRASGGTFSGLWCDVGAAVDRSAGGTRDVACSELAAGRWSWSGTHRPSGRDSFGGLPRAYHGGRCGPFRTSRQLGECCDDTRRNGPSQCGQHRPALVLSVSGSALRLGSRSESGRAADFASPSGSSSRQRAG